MAQAAVILLLLFILPSTALAQLVRDHDGQGLRSFHGSASRIRRSFQSDAEARAVFKHMRGGNSNDTLIGNGGGNFLNGGLALTSSMEGQDSTMRTMSISRLG